MPLAACSDCNGKNKALMILLLALFIILFDSCENTESSGSTEQPSKAEQRQAQEKQEQNLKNAKQEQERKVANNALDSLKKISAALDVGVNFSTYNQMLIDAKNQVNEVEAKMSDGELKMEISKAMDAFLDALTIWKMELEGRTALWKEIAPYAQLINKYSMPTSDFRDTELGRNIYDGIRLEDARQIIWKAGRTHVNKASVLMEKEEK